MEAAFLGLVTVLAATFATFGALALVWGALALAATGAFFSLGCLGSLGTFGSLGAFGCLGALGVLGALGSFAAALALALVARGALALARLAG